MFSVLGEIWQKKHISPNNLHGLKIDNNVVAQVVELLD